MKKYAVKIIYIYDVNIVTAKLSNAFQLFEVFIISTLIFICQNVKITGV